LFLARACLYRGLLDVLRLACHRNGNARTVTDHFAATGFGPAAPVASGF
jgi:hypothetical protein